MKIYNILLAFSEASSLSWIGIRSWTGEICSYPELTSQQVNLCRRNNIIAPAIKNAAKVTTSACFESMSDTLWGCNGIKSFDSKLFPKNNPNSNNQLKKAHIFMLLLPVISRIRSKNFAKWAQLIARISTQNSSLSNSRTSLL